MNDRVNFPNSYEDAISQIHAIFSSRPNRPILITESERDESVYNKIFKDSSISSLSRFLDLGGRQHVKDFIKCIQTESWSIKVKGIIDKDLDIEDHQISDLQTSSLIVTDYADMEMYAFLDENFSMNLEEYLSVKNIPFDYNAAIIQVLKIASPLGAARIIGHSLNPAISIEYKKFDFKRKGNKAYISNIDSSDDETLTDETINGIIRHPNGLILNQKISNLRERIINLIREKDHRVLVKSSIFESILARYFLDKNLTNSATQRAAIDNPDVFMREARNFLKSNPNSILNSQLGESIRALCK